VGEREGGDWMMMEFILGGPCGRVLVVNAECQMRAGGCGLFWGATREDTSPLYIGPKGERKGRVFSDRRIFARNNFGARDVTLPKSMIWQTFARIFIPLLVSIDPFGVVPLFMSMTPRFSEARRRRLAFESTAAAFGIVVAFIFLGEWLFGVLRITVTDFRIAGGILLLVLAILDLLITGKPSVDENAPVGIVPLAMPLIAGPATLTTSLVLSREYGHWVVVGGLAVNFLLLLAMLWAAQRLSRVLGVNALAAFSKLVMLMLAAIAVNFIRVGIVQVVRESAGH
jgi:multiple antibiotic resistance protein